ncbi:Flp family type IVb pilin [Actinoplanes sp. DH11]|uniref:Flp family type IVb pilin n=1 Tax=Actinoplanes sp. DH11 TaxID=2857011 RepID=UPI001E2FEC5B|nr:Flp family type IVb pilin [Actinoplanes sp. DH11]
MEQHQLLAAYLRNVSRSDEGATAVEYSLLAALIAGALIATITLLREDIQAMIERLTAVI